MDKHNIKSISTVVKYISDEQVYIKTLNKQAKQFVVKLFPPTENIYNLLINKVGIYSLTKRHEAELILSIINKNFETKNATLLDATSGIGGFILNMYKYFKYIYGYEINKTQYKILQHNCNIYKISNISLYNDNYTKYINREFADVVIIDPPWGGIDYKTHTKLNLLLDELTMEDLINHIEYKLLLLKLPSNHDLDIFQKYNHTIHKVNNYIIVAIKK